jgi:WD40 repeat protein
MMRLTALAFRARWTALFFLLLAPAPLRAAKLTEQYTLTTKGDKATVMAFSPDGKQFAMAGIEGRIHLWDMETRKEIAALKGHGSDVLSITWSPDGKTLVSGGWDDTIRIWDLATHKESARISVAVEDGVSSVIFLSDGKTVCWGDRNGNARTMKLPPLQEPVKLAQHDGDIKIERVSMTTDGKILVTSDSRGATRLWKLPEGKSLGKLIDEGSERVDVLAQTTDGKSIVGFSHEEGLCAWDISGKKKRVCLVRPDENLRDTITAAAFSTNTKAFVFVTNSAKKSKTNVKLWSTYSRREFGAYETRDSPILSVAFAPNDSGLATLHADGDITLWDLPKEYEQISLERLPLMTLAGHEAPARTVAFSPDGESLASAGDDHRVILWDLADKSERCKLEGHTDDVLCLAFAPQGQILASGCSDGEIKLWDLTTGKVKATLVGQKSPIFSLTFAPDGKSLVSTGNDGFIHIWDVAKGRERSALRWPGDFSRCAAFSPDGKALFAAGSDGTLKRWGKVHANDKDESPADKVGKNPMQFTPDGRFLATGGMGGPIQVWDVSSRKKLTETTQQYLLVRASALTSDASRVVVADAGDQLIQVWDLAGGKPLVTLVGNDQPVLSLSFSPDGKRVAGTCKDRTVKVWLVETGKPVPFLPWPIW